MILTVIAVALIILVFQNFNVVPTATASSNTSSANTIDVNLVSVGGFPLFGKALEVEVMNTPKVKIESDFGGLDVNVTNTPGVKIDSDYGGLDVNVTNYRDFK